MLLFPKHLWRGGREGQGGQPIENAEVGLDLLVQGELGRNIHFGHSLRVSDAQWLARMGVSLLLIQLEARWASDVIARYVAEALMDTISDVYRSGGCAKELQVLVGEVHSPADAERRELESMQDNFRAAFME